MPRRCSTRPASTPPDRRTGGRRRPVRRASAARRPASAPGWPARPLRGPPTRSGGPPGVRHAIPVARRRYRQYRANDSRGLAGHPCLSWAGAPIENGPRLGQGFEWAGQREREQILRIPPGGSGRTGFPRHDLILDPGSITRPPGRSGQAWGLSRSRLHPRALADPHCWNTYGGNRDRTGPLASELERTIGDEVGYIVDAFAAPQNGGIDIGVVTAPDGGLGYLDAVG